MFKDYTMDQLVLPIDLEVSLQDNDIAFHIHHLVESIPDEAFQPFMKNNGCPAYHPRMMLKIILCGYTQSAFSGRKIEALLHDSLRMMWLAQYQKPSYRTINRFRVNPHVQELLRQCFVQFRSQLVEEKLIQEEAIFIDGTKIEANANKFSFVWRRSVERYQSSLIEKSNELYEDLLRKEIIPEIERESSEELSTEELETMAGKVNEVVVDYTNQIETSEDVEKRKRLRSQRKYPKQVYKKLQDMISRKRKYEIHTQRFKQRNSYSKTDHDATFMRMKDDYMRNGQLKAGYNVQVATEGQYALAYDIFPNPTDTRTLIPFLETITNDFFELPSYVVADAGYGSEQNYNEVLAKYNRVPLITYGSYVKEQKRSFKRDLFNKANWKYDEDDDYYTCPNGQKLYFSFLSKRQDSYGFRRTFKVYECESCDGCPLRSSCTKTKEGNNRKIYKNEKWEQQKEYVKELLSETKINSIYKRRKVDVEPFFGFLKANLSFNRFSVRTEPKVRQELGFALMAVNLRKFTARTLKYRCPLKRHLNFVSFKCLFFDSEAILSQPLCNRTDH